MNYILKGVSGILLFNVALTVIPRGVRYLSENKFIEDITWAAIGGISLTDMFYRAGGQGNIGNSLLIGASGVAYHMGQYIHDDTANLYGSINKACYSFTKLLFKHLLKYIVIDSAKYTVGKEFAIPFFIGGAVAYSADEYFTSENSNYRNIMYKAMQGGFNVASYDILSDDTVYNPYIVSANLEAIDEGLSSYMDIILGYIADTFSYTSAEVQEDCNTSIDSIFEPEIPQYGNYSGICPVEERFYSDFSCIKV